MFAKNVRMPALAAALLLWFGLMLSPVLKATEAWTQINHPTLDFLFLDAIEPQPLFEQFYVEPVSVWYPDTSDGLEPPQVAELQRIALDNFSAALVAAGMEQAKAPGPGVLVIHAELIDLKSSMPTPEVMDWASGFRFRVAPGHLTLVAELRDGSNGRVVARLADLEDADQQLALWTSVEAALADWSQVLAATVTTQAEGRLAGGPR